MPGQNPKSSPKSPNPGYGEPECDIYRTLRSVIEQDSPDNFSCPGGERPVLSTQLYDTTDGFEVEVWDDPLTFEVDESSIPPENAVLTPTEPPTLQPTPSPSPTS